MEEGKREVELHEFKQAEAEKQIQRLNSVRKERDNDKVENALKVLKEKAGTNENLMPFIKDAVKEYATIGEITQIFKDVFGEFQEPRTL